jgi:hypothetical protein
MKITQPPQVHVKQHTEKHIACIQNKTAKCLQKNRHRLSRDYVRRRPKHVHTYIYTYTIINNITVKHKQLI